MLTAFNPLLLYVHIPYCIHKCHYCDFNSHVRDHHNWSEYEKALLHELAYWAGQPQFAERNIASIFFGGGTPSLAPPSLIASVIGRVSELFDVDRLDSGLLVSGQRAEITLEANPGTVDISHFTGFKTAGINRLSIGVQSLDDEELKWLERIHDRDQAVAAFESARAAGFDNINLDLMYGLPDQSLESWMQRLDEVIELNPEHLSCYQLTVEPHTKLAASLDTVAGALPDEELALRFLKVTRSHLEGAGYRAYELSNFSKAEFYCRHNDGYWRYRDYIGIGAGASGKWDISGGSCSGGVKRYSNIRQPEKYMQAAVAGGRAINSDETLTAKKAAAEAVWLGLRRSSGLNLACFFERFGKSVNALFGDVIDTWVQRGCLERNDYCIRLTDAGLALADAIAVDVIAHSS